jgi:hypothetical protein
MDQLSFDRLDDSDTHHIENIQITHLKCNINKADQQYQPDKRYLRHYTDNVKEFMTINDYLKKNQVSNRLECINYTLTLRRYLAYLHDIAYGTRKVNQWKARIGTEPILTTAPARVRPQFISQFTDELISI